MGSSWLLFCFCAIVCCFRLLAVLFGFVGTLTCDGIKYGFQMGSVVVVVAALFNQFCGACSLAASSPSWSLSSSPLKSESSDCPLGKSPGMLSLSSVGKWYILVVESCWSSLCSVSVSNARVLCPIAPVFVSLCGSLSMSSVVLLFTWAYILYCWR